MACCSPEKSSRLSTGVLFIGLAFLAAFNYWWPGILLILGIYRGLKFFLDCNHKSMWAHIIIFIGLYLIFACESSVGDVLGKAWILPAIFVIVAICCFLKACCKKSSCCSSGGGGDHHHGDGHGQSHGGKGGGCCGG